MMNTKLNNIRRIFLIGDLHLGIRNSSLEWSEIQRKFLVETFPKQIEPYFDPETDILVFEGDIFHNRDSINVRVYNEAYSIFKFLTSKFKRGVYIVVGNHDVYYKSTNVVNSIEVLKNNFPNLYLYTSPEVIEINDKHRFLMLPWIENVENLKKTVASYINRADYIVCHADIAGFSLNKYQKVEKGLEPASLHDFKRVYAGHIHIKQEKWNVNYTGTPFAMDRGDRDSQKGFYILDVLGDDVSETYIENLESPRFIKVDIQDILELNKQDIANIFKNNFVDIMIETRIATKLDVSRFNEVSEEFGARKIEFFTYSDEKAEKVKQEGQTKDISVMDAFNFFLDELEADREHKYQVHQKFQTLYKSLKETSHV